MHICILHVVTKNIGYTYKRKATSDLENISDS